MLIKRFAAVCALFALLLSCGAGFGCARPLSRYETSYLDVFDTVTQVVLYAPDRVTAQAHFDRIHSELTAYHQQFDIYHDYPGITNLKTVNDAAGGAPVSVAPCVLDLLQTARRMSKLTDGRMNAAMGSVLSLWHDARIAGLADPDHAALPDAAVLDEAARHTDIDQVIIDESAGTVRLADPLMRLDVGAIAKGYAAEQAVASAQAAGLESLLLNIGGNVRALGKRPDGTPWQVAVESPGGGAPVCILSVTDKSFVTSGVYQRYYVVDGTQYHHIIDPDTRMPAARFSSVSVLCRDSAMADALSTGLFCMPLAQGLALVESLADTEALWIAADGTQTESSGFAEYVR